jgi:hypothetical protein
MCLLGSPAGSVLCSIVRVVGGLPTQDKVDFPEARIPEALLPRRTLLSGSVNRGYPHRSFGHMRFDRQLLQLFRSL